MSTHIHARRLAALLGACALALPLHAQQQANPHVQQPTRQGSADDPQAAVPATRYQAAHVHPAAQAPAATPDRNWQALNRIVAGQDGHDAGAHAGHAHPAPAKEQEAGGEDPHAHHGHHEHGAQAGHARHQHQEHHK